MSTHETEHGYELTDAKSRPLVIAVLGLTLLIAVTVAAVSLMESYFANEVAQRSTPHPLADLREGPQGPVLQAHPTNDYTEYEAAQQITLEGYGWIDRENGIVRIPIEQAMERVIERGLPVREEVGE